MLDDYCVYSAVFGGYDSVASIGFDVSNPKFFLYSDTGQRAKGWAVTQAAALEGDTPELSNRFLKTFPPKDVLSYQFAFYVDGNVKIQASLNDLFLEFKESGADIGFFRHSDRETLREELDACEKARKVPKGVGIEQIESYENDGFVGQIPLLEGSMFFRKNTPLTAGMMTMWSQEIRKWKTRDQLGLPYAIWKSGAKLHVFSGSPRRMYSRFVYTAHGGRSVFDFIFRAIALTMAKYPAALDSLSQFWRSFRSSSMRAQNRA